MKKIILRNARILDGVRIGCVLLATLLLALPVGASGAHATLHDTRMMEELASRHPRKAIEQANAELARARAAADRPAQLKAYRLLAMSNDALDDNPGLRDAAAKGLALARELDDKPAQVEFLRASATSAHHEGRGEESLRLHDQAMALAQAHGLQRELAKSYQAKAYALVYQGHEHEAMELLLKAHTIFEGLDEKLHMAGTLSEVGNILTTEESSRENLLRAVDYHRRAMDLLDAKANRFELVTVLHNLGTTLYHLGDHTEARRTFEKCLALARDLDDPHTVAYVNYRLGMVDLAENAPGRALARFAAAVPPFHAAENLAMELVAYLGQARAHAALKRRREALSALAAARELATRLGTPAREAKYHEVAATVHAALGEWEAAYREMSALRSADKRTAAAANQRLAAELQARFDTRQRESENKLLRMELQVEDARHMVLLMVLGLSALIGLGLVSWVVRQMRRSQRYAALAMRDELTQLPNRRSILEFARAQFRGRRGDDKGFVLALIDIDHFKSINDQLGHSVGDEVLKAFAQACQSVLRAEDRLGRFGGEEFVLVMPGSGLDKVPAVFERLREAAMQIRLPELAARRVLTFSLGATAAGAADPDLDTIIKRADEALYRAKNAGRNRYEVERCPATAKVRAAALAR